VPIIIKAKRFVQNVLAKASLRWKNLIVLSFQGDEQ